MTADDDSVTPVDSAIETMTGDAARKLALSFPEAVEQETWGIPTFRVRDRIFMTMGDDGRWVVVKATHEAQAALVGSEPDVYSIPPYFGRHGWVGVALERIERGDLADLVAEAWRATAPRALVRDQS
jgi:hypothetical protein